MARFYFHLFNRIGAAPDPEGRELPDLDAARAAAKDDVRSLLSEDVKAGLLDFNGRIDIADAAGHVLDTVPFRDAVELRLD